MLDGAAQDALAANLPAQALAPWLSACGYHRVGLAEDGSIVLVGRHGLASHHGPQLFYRPAWIQDSEMLGQIALQWSAHAVALASMTDAVGLETHVEHDWRFLAPISITDPNRKVQRVALDALGRVVQSRFHGFEHGTPAGYHPTQVFVMPHTVEPILALEAGKVPVASAQRLVSDSWMPLARDSQGRLLDTRMGELAWRRLAALHGWPLADLASLQAAPGGCSTPAMALRRRAATWQARSSRTTTPPA